MNRPVPLNVFQHLMRRWDAVHPYNAAQAMHLSGTPDVGRLAAAWAEAVAETGLGAVAVARSRYRYTSLNGHAAKYPVAARSTGLAEYLSAEMNRPFDDPDEPPFRPFVLTGDGTYHLGLVYQHWLADSVSIRSLVGEWFARAFDPAAARRSPFVIGQTGYWNSVGPGRAGWSFAEGLLNLTRRHTRLRRARKVDSHALSDPATRFAVYPAAPGTIGRLRAVAADRGVKVNDLFLAALAEACHAHVPLQPRPNRRDLAVGSVVDLRPYAPPAVAESFGLLLGFTNVVCQPDELADFDRLVAAVAAQTRHQKARGVAPSSLMWMSAALIVGKLSKPKELYHFYRKELPLAGGLSNVDLTRTWLGRYHPDPVLDYVRVSPTGPMAPLAVTTTTLCDQLHVGLTHRTGLIDPALADAIAAAFLNRLARV